MVVKKKERNLEVIKLVKVKEMRNLLQNFADEDEIIAKKDGFRLYNVDLVIIQEDKSIPCLFG